MNAKELQQFKKKLVALRQALEENVEHLEEDAHKAVGGGLPLNHLADAGSDTFDEEISFSQLENEENLIAEIDDALKRIENKEYGVCISCDKKIPIERLEALPFARLCVPCQEQEEREAPARSVQEFPEE